MPPSAVAKTFFMLLDGCLLNDALASASLVTVIVEEDVVPDLLCCATLRENIAPDAIKKADRITNFFIIPDYNLQMNT